MREDQRHVDASTCAGRIVAAIVVLGAATGVHAREEPLWEAGLGVAGLVYPDYRGSDHTSVYALPLPYFVYRGDIFKADRQGVRSELVRGNRFDLQVSVGASLPVDSSRNRAREGMPSLKPSVEAGPSLNVVLWRMAEGRAKLDLRMPLRGAVTIASQPRFIGVQFFPHLNVDWHDPAGMGGWNLGVLGGPIFTDGRYNRYFYSVASEFATAERPAYQPRGGYAGSQLTVALSKRFPRFWVGAFARYDTLRGAAFESSPLAVSRSFVAVGAGISWILGESQRRVTVDEFGEKPR